MPAAEHFRAIVETAVDAVVSIDDTGRIETFNASAERLFGYRAEEVEGRNVSLLMDGATARQHDGHLRRVLAGGEPHIIGVGREVTGRHRDGTPIALHLSVGAMEVDGRAGFVGIMRDIRPEIALRNALRSRDSEYASVTDAMTDGLIVQRWDGGVVTCNPAARRILGLEAEVNVFLSGPGFGWNAIREDGTAIAPMDHPESVARRTGRRVDNVVMGIEHADGQLLWLEVESFPVDLADEYRPGVATMFRDITAAREAEGHLAERERSYRLLAENSTDLVMRTTRDSAIIYASPRLATLLGYEPEAILGTWFTELIHPEDRLRHRQTQARIDRAAGVTSIELRLRRDDGAWEWCEATVRAVRGPGGRVIERQSAIRSIARRKRDQAALNESLGRHRALIGQLPGTAVVMFDRALRVQVAEGPAVATLLVRERAVGEHLADVAGPDRGHEIRAAGLRALSGAAHRLTLHRGGRVLDATITPVTADDGEIIGGMVVATDVTERMSLEVEQRALHEIAQAVAEDATPGAVLALVADRVAFVFGAVGAAVFRCENDAVVAVATAPETDSGIQPGDRFEAGGASALARVLELGVAQALPEYPETSDPLVVALREMGAVGGAAAPITVRGELWGVLGFGGSDPARLGDETARRLGRFADLVATTIANADRWQRLQQRASTDGLTGLSNRAAFDERLAEELSRARRSGGEVALALIDADNFKRVNDEHGHAVGDLVLASIAATLRGAARGSDMVARVGGEEFAWVMPGVDVDQAFTAVDRMRRSMEEISHGVAGVVTVSAGVAALGSREDGRSLFARADRALYAAKQAGRNRVAPRARGMQPVGSVALHAASSGTDPDRRQTIAPD